MKTIEPARIDARELRRRTVRRFLEDLGLQRSFYKLDDLGSEITRIAIPAALALVADPLASLVDTAFIGQINSVGLAAVGVSIAIFNQVSKVAIYPLVSVTTSFVAEEDAICRRIVEERENGDLEKATPINSEMEEQSPCNVIRISPNAAKEERVSLHELDQVLDVDTEPVGDLLYEDISLEDLV